MIGYIRGEVKAIVRDTLIITTGGPGGGTLGYRVHTPSHSLAMVNEGDTRELWTYLAVRENAQDLFGFETREELQWFELLLTVSGIGPRSALSILNSADISTLENAIAQNDASVLARAFGIGRKTAEKIVLELKEKVEPQEKGSYGNDGDVIEALVSLGYSLKEARDTARALPKELEGAQARIREALRIISGTR